MASCVGVFLLLFSLRIVLGIVISVVCVVGFFV